MKFIKPKIKKPKAPGKPRKIGNRTIIGIVCIIAAFAVCFGVVPLVNQVADEQVEIVRMRNTLLKGSCIGENDIEVVMKEKTTFTPPDLSYLRVITSTTSGGIDKADITDSSQPVTVTLLVNQKQAELLAQYEKTASMHFTLEYRGDTAIAQQYLSISFVLRSLRLEWFCSCALHPTN